MIASVVTDDVVSTRLSEESCVDIVTVPAATTHDGVSTFDIVSTYSTPDAMPVVPHVNLSSRASAV